MKTREELQETAVELSKYYKNLIFEWATGLGKSKAVIDIIKNDFIGTLDYVVLKDWCIVIAETNHELNWKEEFKKYNAEYLLQKITFTCYQSLHKHLNHENYIFDEVHHLQSDKRLDLLDIIIKKKHYNKLIGLSATLTWKQKQNITDIIGKTKVHKVTLSDAIDWNILPEPTVYLIGIELDNINKNQVFNFKKDSSILCTEAEKYKKLTDKVEYFKEVYMTSRLPWQKNNWLRTASERKRFMSDCKTKHVKTLLEILKDKRVLTFTGSIAQSEELSNGNSIHSKLTKKQRESLLERFNGGEIDKLFATGMLKEGQNLNNIQVGIVVQLDNVERYFSQTHGRILRSLSPEYYILYLKNTQDETYVKTALSNFNNEYVIQTDINTFINGSNTEKEMQSAPLKFRGLSFPPGEADWI
jgi:superfamily II DNA or RNA helicase